MCTFGVLWLCEAPAAREGKIERILRWEREKKSENLGGPGRRAVRSGKKGGPVREEGQSGGTEHDQTKHPHMKPHTMKP